MENKKKSKKALKKSTKNKKSGNTKKSGILGIFGLRKKQASNGSVTKNNKKSKSKKGWKNMGKVKKILIIFIIIMFLLVLAGIGIFAGIFFSDKFAITAEELLIGHSNTIIYDSEGNVIAELSGEENRKIISKDQMSEYLPKAFVAIEDERFYSHHGIDIKRTAAATVSYIVQGGSSSFGGSTITQQLVKNITNEKDNSGMAGIERKIKEMSRAYQIENMISKDQILELYLNLIPLGASGKDLCGVEIASMYYFNKSASDLTIEECAFLAGINHAPNKYNPFKGSDNSELIKNRTKTVLNKMLELEYISSEQYNEAISKVDQGIQFSEGVLPSSTITSYYTSAAVNEIINQLVAEKGWSKEYAEQRVYGGGYKIYTNQVTSIQTALEEEYKNEKYLRTSKKVEGAHSQSAMVIIDNDTGRVVGCVGGLGTDVNAVGLNRIYSPRQPGSSIKPIVAYGAGIYYNAINAATVYDNAYTYFGNYGVNSTGTYSGLCSIRQAIEVSTNAVACKILSEVGPDRAIDLARNMGITTLVKESENVSKNDSNLSLALGGITYGVSPLEMAAAYATIANNGVYNSPTFYTRVEDSDGNIVIESKQETRKVMSEQVAYMIKSILKQPVIGGAGTARNCSISGMYVGAKTGTTNDNYDRWLCGFTEYYTGATWYGFDVNEYINYSGNPAAHIWSAVMKKVHAGLPSKTLQRPSNIVTARICKTSGCLATDTCKDTYTEEFIVGTVPSECKGHVTYKICNETGKLATEFCTNTSEKIGITMPPKEQNATWRTNPGDKYLTITETCNVHTSAPEVIDPNENTVTGTDVIISNVVGKTKAEAENLLKGLTIEFVTASDSTKPNGVVLKQPTTVNGTVLKEGTGVSKGTKIKLTINSIKEPEKQETNTGSGSNTNSENKNNTSTTTNSGTAGNTSSTGNTNSNTTNTGNTTNDNNTTSTGTSTNSGTSTGSGSTTQNNSTTENTKKETN